jgi:hypothetical protein
MWALSWNTHKLYLLNSKKVIMAHNDNALLKPQLKECCEPAFLGTAKSVNLGAWQFIDLSSALTASIFVAFPGSEFSSRAAAAEGHV